MTHPSDSKGGSSLSDANLDQFALAAFNQNFETFRALNALMWQIPLIAMTLTGGLWFGVSKVEEAPGFRLGLLLLAGLGNVGLIVVLERLRFIIGRYLDWLRDAFPSGHVPADGDTFLTRSRTVKLVFQLMLGFAAAISLVLSIATMATVVRHLPVSQPTSTAAWYDAHAEQLADGYEGLEASKVHQELFDILEGSRPLRILDVGAGTGRDAAALALMGHAVTAVEPSSNMSRLAQALHPGTKVAWSADALPALAGQRGPFDLVILSAVWMHVPPSERRAALKRLAELTAPSGRIYMTLRLGPAEPGRGIFKVDIDELRRLAADEGLRLTKLADQVDLLGRNGISWTSTLLHQP
jgi:protein-L-isoaspartate O-methyltransferase